MQSQFTSLRLPESLPLPKLPPLSHTSLLPPRPHLSAGLVIEQLRHEFNDPSKFLNLIPSQSSAMIENSARELPRIRIPVNRLSVVPPTTPVTRPDSPEVILDQAKSIFNFEIIELPEDARLRKLSSCIPLIGYFIGHHNESSLLKKIHDFQDLTILVKAIAIKNQYKLCSMIRVVITTGFIISQFILPCLSAALAPYTLTASCLLALASLAKRYNDYASNSIQIIFARERGLDKTKIS